MKYAILTFGCRVNQADSFEFEESLRARGAVEAPVEAADLVIVNTCTVTGAADQGARRTIRRIARDNAAARIVVTGCYATRDPGKLAALPQVATLVPNDGKERFVRILRSASDLRALGFPPNAPGFPPADVTTALRFGDGGCGSALAPGAMGRTAYPLRVQTGCDETCAFCIIPSTRGRSRSRALDQVLAEAGRIAAAGYKEIWLVGVHLGSYGRDLQPAVTLLDLLRALDGSAGDVTFRISSIEPMDCPDGLLDLVGRSGRIAPHFHLPLQHASDRMLAAMRRPYTFEFYRQLTDRLHTRLPHASVGTDLIAGFPGETDADVDFSLHALESLALSYLHVFPYSDRDGTEAAAMTPKVPADGLRPRSQALRALGTRLTDRFVRAQVGTIRPGLTLDDGTTVLTDNFLKIRIPPGLARNARVRVRLDSAALSGTLVS